MRIDLDAVSKGADGGILPPTSVTIETGRVTLATAETEQRPSVLGLIAVGRMRPDAGSVTLDGHRGARRLRRVAALVDAPDVNDPAPDVAVVGVVEEELMFAGRRADPLSARRWLDEHGWRHLARTPIAEVAADVRVRMLLELAALRRGIEVLVLVSPDRHGGDPCHWQRIADDFAGRGFAVLVITGTAAAAALAPTTTHPRIGRPRLRAAAALRGSRRRPASVIARRSPGSIRS
ncbi:hypothetical protein ACIGEP_10935 [Microbacterium sp. NPDC077663]|uniref:hypothetical protein n=1 Tax=Microbacterium sp. NPDC077663 TaxID=3364189 RepID=UPI0037C8CB85